jgi:hypothetical protein
VRQNALVGMLASAAQSCTFAPHPGWTEQYSAGAHHQYVLIVFCFVPHDSLNLCPPQQTLHAVIGVVDEFVESHSQVIESVALCFDATPKNTSGTYFYLCIY